jgi:outer membrane protein assembly factor BamB
MQLLNRSLRHLALLALAGLLSRGMAVAADDGITAYHGDQARSGDYVMPGLTWQAARSLHRDSGFDGKVNGKVYAQPLFWRPQGSGHGMLIVATENDEVDALDAVTGRLLWHRKLGMPVSGPSLPCGDINPLGITGTPVIDRKTATLYLDAMVEQAGGPQHLVFALHLADGAVMSGWPVNVRQALRSRDIAFDPRVQNQRGALALLDHRVFVAFGGLAGDCGDYHGIVLGLPVNPAQPAAAPVAAWATRGLKGGIWARGGISTADNALFFATGNTEDARRWADGEGVFRFGAELARTSDPHDFFVPANWKRLDETDLDMSGVSPLPVDPPGGAHRLLALGKDGYAYLLNRDDLGGVGAPPLARLHVAQGQIVTSPAVFPDRGRDLVAFQAASAACPGGRFDGGIAVIAVTASSLAPVWCAPLDGRGAPAATTTDGHSDPVVWVTGAQGDDRLHGFRGDTGQPLYTSPQPIAGLRRFDTILAANHRLYVAGDNRVVVFSWTAR